MKTTMRKKLLLIFAILLTATQGTMAMQFFVKTITNSTITIDVDNSSVNIHSVKEIIRGIAMRYEWRAGFGRKHTISPAFLHF